MIRSLNILLIVFAFAAPLTAWSEPIRIGGTTSVRDSGLLDALQTAFSEDTGRDMQFIVGGTGRVLKLLKRRT